MLRLPAVAGKFYPGHPRELTSLIAKFTDRKSAAEPVHVRACLVPHAGYVYSGVVAGAVFSRIFLQRVFCFWACAISRAENRWPSSRKDPGEHRWEMPPSILRWPSVYVQPARLCAKTPPRTARSTLWKCNCHSCRNSIQDSRLYRWCSVRSASINWSRWEKESPAF